MQLRMHAAMDDPPVIVLGNKRDLSHSEVTSEMVDLFRSKNPDVLFAEVSARSGHHCNEAVGELCLKMLESKKSVTGIRLKNNRHSKAIEEFASTADTLNKNPSFKGKRGEKSSCCKS
jgi:ribosome biogenesis GTPase A